MARTELTDLHFEHMTGEVMYQFFCQEFRSSNRRIFDRIRYLDVNEMIREDHLVCFTEGRRLVGDLALQQSPRDVDVIWLKHVSVDEKFRRNGIARRLIELCVEHVRPLDKRIEVSTYSPLGQLYLAPLIQEAIFNNQDVDIIESRRDGNDRSFCSPR